MKKVPFRVLAFVVFCLTMVGLAWYFAHWLESLPGRAWQESRRELVREASRIRDQFQAFGFQPVIRINDRVVFEKKMEIAELSLLARPTEVDHEFMQTWAGSTKKLHLRGKFLVKSGFDLRERLEVVVRKDHTVVSLPAAQILSVELINLDLQTENGWWNQITDAEQKQEIARLRELARQQGGPLNREAEESFRQRLRAALGDKVEVRIGTSGPEKN